MIRPREAAALLLALLFLLWPDELPRLPSATAAGAPRPDPLRVGLDPAFPPFAYRGPDGDIRGIDPELAEAVARRAGLRLELVPVAYDGLYSALEGGRIHAAMGGLPYEAHRTRTVRYTQSYLEGGQVLIVRREDPADELLDLNKDVLAAQLGSEGDAQLRRHGWRLRRATILHTPTQEAALQAVLQGRARGAVVDALLAADRLPQLPELRRAARPVSHVPYVVAVPIGSDWLWKQFEDTIANRKSVPGTLR